LAYILNMHQEEGPQLNMENMKSELTDDTKESILERDEEKDTEEGGFKMVHNKKVKYVTTSRNNSRVVEKNSMVMGKEKRRKLKAFHDAGMNTSNSYSAFNSFDPQHFVRLATASRILLGIDNTSETEIIETLQSQERAHAMLTKARVRKEKESQTEKDKILRF
jgi:hypothetical protein